MTGNKLRSLTLELPYPVSLNNIYRVYRGKIVPSAEATRFANEIKYICSQHKPKIFKGPVSLVVEIRPKITIKGEASKVCVDIDNPLKKLLDAMQGIVYENDKQVRRLYVYYGEPVPNGALIVTIEEHE